MTSKFSKEFGNIICPRKDNIINSLIQNKLNLSFDFIELRFNHLIIYCKEFIDYLYNYRYNVDNIDDNYINFNSNINDDFIINNSTFLNHEIFLIFEYFRDNNFNITELVTNNIINIFISMLDNIIS